MATRIIRNFEIKEMIGRGGMASLYKAVQTSLDRVVAIKELYPHLARTRSSSSASSARPRARPA